MSKSNYPSKLDTSIEIPAVRDNIIEVGSDVLNSIRSALFQIEKTLGINPQGATGNTVSDRLNKVLDGNGNILKEALDRASVLSGPIVDSDVSKTAAINESKLRLDYPTQLLQDEVSQLLRQVDIMLETIDELAVLFNAHVHTSATNRHKGQAITIEAIENTTSSTAATSLDVTTSQGAFETIFESHINYDGSDISITNRSHEADQLFFDTTDVSAYISSEDVQGAIEDILAHAVGQLDDHQNHQHDNGVNRTGKIVSAAGAADDEGVVILDEIGINYIKTPSSHTSQDYPINFDTAQDIPELEIKKSDILQITDSTGTSQYQISEVVLSEGDATIAGLLVFGRFGEDSESGAEAKIFRNINREANFGGLLVSVREYEADADGDGVSTSNADIIQISNPEAATIITRNIKPSEVTHVGSPANRYFSLTIDEGTAIDLDIYDEDATSQTIDTIIKRLNEQFAANAASVSAYRIDFDETRPSEVALVHSIESTSTNTYSLKVSRGSDDALDSMGLADFEDAVIDAGLGTAYYIQGKTYNGLGTKLAETGLELLAGTNSIVTTSLDFIEKTIALGDLIVVAGSASDDGTYRISSVVSDIIEIDSEQLSGGIWAGESDSDTEFYVFKNSLSFTELAFSEISEGTGLVAVADIFMNYDRDIFYNTRLEYGSLTSTPISSLVSIVDFDGDITVYTGSEGLGLRVENQNDEEPYIPTISLDGGAEVELSGTTNSYVEVSSGIYDIKLMLFIEDSSELGTYIDANGTAHIPLVGHEGVNEEENLLLSRVTYEALPSRVTGAGSLYPRTFPKLRRGTLGHKDLGSDAIYANQQRPLLETRSNGVIRGLTVTTPDLGDDALERSDAVSYESINGDKYYVIDIAGGVCYVKGKRFEIEAKTELVTGIQAPGGTSPTADKFFVAIDQWGGVVFAPSSDSGGSGPCVSPFDPYDYCVLCTVEFNGDGVDTGDPPFVIDLRLFIDNLDLTVLNSITVSPQRGMGHFTSINDALKYAKRFSEAYTEAGIPTVHLKSGIHKITAEHNWLATEIGTSSITGKEYLTTSAKDGVYINFPVNITGEGHSTVVEVEQTWPDIEDVFGMTGSDIEENKKLAHDSPFISGIIIAGPGISTSSPDIDPDVIGSGFVNLSNFRMRLSYISVWDPAIKNSDGYNINWGVNIDNVTFDASECSEALAGECLYGVSLTCADLDPTAAGDEDQIGNLSVTNCQFLNSAIRIEVAEPAYVRNINISNNVSRGSGGDGVTDGATNFLIHCVEAGSIFDTSYSPIANNIQIVGNICADNEDGTATIDSDGEFSWSDRPLNTTFQDNLLISGETELTLDTSVDGYVRVRNAYASADALSLESYGSVRIVLDSNGNDFDADGDGHHDGDKSFQVIGPTAEGEGVLPELGYTAGALSGIENDGFVHFHVGTDGYVGIGTDDPDAQLSVIVDDSQYLLARFHSDEDTQGETKGIRIGGTCTSSTNDRTYLDIAVSPLDGLAYIGAGYDSSSLTMGPDGGPSQANIIIDSNTGYVGVGPMGTNAPDALLSVVAYEQHEAVLGVAQFNTSSDGPNVNLIKGSTVSHNSTISAGHYLGSFKWQSYDNAASLVDHAGIYAKANTVATDGSYSETDMMFYVHRGSEGFKEAMRIASGGRVTIANTDAADYALSDFGSLMPALFISPNEPAGGNSTVHAGESGVWQASGAATTSNSSFAGYRAWANYASGNVKAQFSVFDKTGSSDAGDPDFGWVTIGSESNHDVHLEVGGQTAVIFGGGYDNGSSDGNAMIDIIQSANCTNLSGSGDTAPGSGGGGGPGAVGLCVRTTSPHAAGDWGWALMNSSQTASTAESHFGIMYSTDVTDSAALILHSYFYADELGSEAFFDRYNSAYTFTGQHRNVIDEPNVTENIDKYVGLIVCSSGVYDNTVNYNDDKPVINEALPVCKMSRKRNDKTVWGVVSASEDLLEGGQRKHDLGGLVFAHKRKSEDDIRFHINSLGEGAIWVCNINGDLENGDYITSCEIPGYGMRQDDDLLHNYTVAKITCDCTFDLNSNIYECVEFEFDGQTYKKAFVGCTYHCG